MDVAVDTIPRMSKSLLVALWLVGTLAAADLPSKKYLNLAAIKTMVARAEAEAKRQNVSVTICIVDENGASLFLEKGDANQPVNFIHVLDLAFLLPVLCITAVLLFRRKAVGIASIAIEI
jgi:hypothetical protein